MTIDERLAKLESNNRTCRRLLFGLILLLGWTVNLALDSQSMSARANTAVQVQKVYDNLRVKKLELVDKDGKLIGELASSGEGGLLALYSPDRDRTFVCGVTDSLSGLHIVTKNGSSFLADMGFMLLNSNKKVVTHISTLPDLEGGSIIVANPLGKPVVALVSGNDNGGKIRIINADEKIVWRAP